MAEVIFYFILSWPMALHPHLAGGEHQYFLLLKVLHIWGKEPRQPISILGWNVKSEDTPKLSTLKVLDSNNSLSHGQKPLWAFHMCGVY